MVRTATSQCEHPVRFYQEDQALIPSLCGFLLDGLGRGDAALVAVTPAHEPLVRAELHARGAAHRLPMLRFLDAEALAADLTDEGISAEVFERLVGEDLRAALARSKSGRVTVYGEIVDVLWREGREAEACALEKVWDGFLRRLPIRLMCGYKIDPLDTRCAKLAELHDAVLPQPEIGPRVHRLEEAVVRTLGHQSNMVRAMIGEEPRLRALPFGMAALLWLSRHAPVLAGRVRALV